MKSKAAHSNFEASMIGKERFVRYHGNRMWQSVPDVSALPPPDDLGQRVLQLAELPHFSSLHRIDRRMFLSTVEYFTRIGADWCNLPLTTLMISSPGEVYAGRTLDYTTDTLPVELSWFDHPKRVFLSESSQFYLELRLLTQGVDRVFSIYNSFRKERADFTHLTEFQHIEFEGHVDFDQNIDIAQGLLRSLTGDLVLHEYTALSEFLTDDEISNVTDSFSAQAIPRMTLREALDALLADTMDDRYREFSLKHFGAWEEIRLTQLLDSHVWLTHFPMLEIPFYHRSAQIKEGDTPLALNADLILKGGRETVGAGVRMNDAEGLREKSRIFNLPPADYAPYLQTRECKAYKPSAGFGLGWQRYVQWLIKAPAIWHTTHVPRGHWLPQP